MHDRQREEVLNTCLADVLHAFGINADPETIQSGGKHRPDVILDYRGMRVVIEGKLADTAKARDKVAQQAQQRVDLGIAQIALAVVYPATLRSEAFQSLRREMAKIHYDFCVFSELGGEWGVGQWRSGDIATVLEELRRVREELSETDIVQEAATQLSLYLDGVARLFQANPTLCEELAELLGVGKPGQASRNITEKRNQTTAKVAALTIANAFIFQEQLAISATPGVKSIHALYSKDTFILDTLEHWQWICDTINYVPIFQLAINILKNVPGSHASLLAVRKLAEQSLVVCMNQAALRHDLMGRIYHFLLHEAKFLGTYYTSVPAATLLLKLALDPAQWQIDFSDPEALKEFRAADLTCGTGTLLMATCQAVTDNFVTNSVQRRKKITDKRLRALHQVLMERIIHGYDVLPSAIHLTASTLALLAPEVVFDKLALFSMPLTVRGKSVLLGSLEFLEEDEAKTQLSFLTEDKAETRMMTGKGAQATKARMPLMDLFVMNPPFVRSVNGNLLFGSLPDKHREKMQTALKQRVLKTNIQASITAGLGSVFVALADKYVKPGGCLAFVLPAALTTGVAWRETRALIQARYHLQYVVTSHQTEHWSFSENTDLSEILFIARRLQPDEDNAELETCFVNLWRNPRNIGDALAVARTVKSTEHARILDNSDAVADLSEIKRKYGELVCVPMRDLQQNGWWGGAFAQTDLLRVVRHLQHGRLALPGTQAFDVPMTTLGDIAVLGPDARDVHDGFEITDNPTAYPAFWDHKADKVTCLQQQPNRWLSPRNQPAPGRKRIIATERLWPKASRLFHARFDVRVSVRSRVKQHLVYRYL